jgi:LysR family cyn operon transcriptional activator
MNLQQLRYLVALADHGTMTAAAQAVPVAQPVISRALRSLEHELNVSLIRKDGRGVALTPMGLRASEMCREVLDGVQAIAEIGSPVALTEVRMLMWPVLEELFAERLLTVLNGTQSCEVAIDTISNNNEGSTRLLQGEAHFGVLIDTPSAQPELEWRSIGSVFVGVLARADHQLPVPLPDHLLTDMALVWKRAWRAAEQPLRELLHARGLHPNIVVETGGRTSWPSMVRAGRGHALSLTVQNCEPDLVVLPIDPPLEFPLALVHRRVSASSPIRAIGDALVRQLREMVAMPVDPSG